MCPAQRRVKAEGPWQIEWEDDVVILRTFDAKVTVFVNANNPQVTIVDVDHTHPEAEAIIQIEQDGDICREF